LNPSGQLVQQSGQPIILLANDDVGTTPASPSAAYVVQENINGSSVVEYSIIISVQDDPFLTDLAAVFTHGSAVVQLTNVLASGAFVNLSSTEASVTSEIVAFDPIANTVTLSAAYEGSTITVNDLKVYYGVDLSTLAQYEPAPTIMTYIPFTLDPVQTDGQVATWSASEKKWIPTTPGGGSSSVQWVDLGLVDLVSAVMNGPQTLYDMPEGSFLASIRFTDDPDSVMSDFANLPPSFVASLYMWPAFGTVKSFGWVAFAGIKPPAFGSESPGLSYDTLFLAAQNGGYGPFAALDAGATDFNASVLSAATVGPIEAALLVSEAGGNVTGTSWRAAPIVAWEADTSYDGSQDNTVATPGALKKAIILANGTLWVNEESGPALSGSSEPDFAGNAGGSVGDGALTPAFLYGDEPLSLPLTIVSSVNDTFVYTGTGGAGSPETFTVAPGVYSTTSEAIAAFAAAIGAAHGEAFSTLATVTLFSDDYQALTLTMVAPGPSQNGNTITEGNGGAAAFGLTGNPDTFAYGGQAIEWLDTTSPPPTVGAVHLVAEIVTPVAL
jgi:hypothetical protein